MKKTQQSYENIIRPAQYDIFLRSESEKRLFSSVSVLASQRFRLAGQSLRSRQRGDIRQCHRPSFPQISCPATARRSCLHTSLPPPVFSPLFPNRVAPFRETRQRRAEPPARESTKQRRAEPPARKGTWLRQTESPSHESILWMALYHSSLNQMLSGMSLAERKHFIICAPM